MCQESYTRDATKRCTSRKVPETLASLVEIDVEALTFSSGLFQFDEDNFAPFLSTIVEALWTTLWSEFLGGVVWAGVLKPIGQKLGILLQDGDGEDGRVAAELQRIKAESRLVGSSGTSLCGHWIKFC